MRKTENIKIHSAIISGYSCRVNPKILFFLGLCLYLILGGCEEKETFYPAPKRSAYEGVIVAVGDSLTEGLGVEEELAYPALLEHQLAATGYAYQVINAGISGETSSGALSRVKWILTLKPDIVILVTGANDGLRGIDPGLTKSNIVETIQVLKDHGTIIVLGGMRIIKNLGEEYTAAFSKIYSEIAQNKEVIFIPFFLDGVAGETKLNQADGIHPTADGYRKVVDNIYPYVIEAIKKHKATQK